RFSLHVIYFSHIFSNSLSFIFLLSSPTRRSSDLATEISKSSVNAALANLADNGIDNVTLVRLSAEELTQALNEVRPFRRLAGIRSEEHTSELQSRENLVCRLLLEKKKKRETINNH